MCVTAGDSSSRQTHKETRLVAQPECAGDAAVGVVVEKMATFEDLDPSRWRGSCKLVDEDFQDAKVCTCNLLNCPCCVQRRCVVGLALGEESCDCRLQIGKWANVPRFLCPPEIRVDEQKTAEARERTSKM